MYESFYQFNERPFGASPLASRYFPGAAIEDARQRLSSAIERSAGPGMVVGPTGSGKTMLCHVLAQQYRGRLAIVQLESAQLCTRRALLQAILFELGQNYRNLDEGSLRLSLMDYLAPSENCPNGMLLLVDEAHTLPHKLLEEIRMITNLVRDGQPRVRLVLSGSPKLEEVFAHPRFESFNQRLATRSYLEAFNAQETRQFVTAQIAASSANGNPVFDDEALSAVYRATDGIPRLVNQLCDHALVLGFASGSATLSSAKIEEAWADLQQLPTPWSGEVEDETPAMDVIEFGSLDDDSPSSQAAETFGEIEISSIEVAESSEVLLVEPLDGALNGSLDVADELELVEESSDSPRRLYETLEELEFALFSEGEKDQQPVELTAPSSDAIEPSHPQNDAIPFPVVDFPSLGEVVTPNSGAHEAIELSSSVLPSTESSHLAASLTKNPFDEEFEDEELVIDDFATLGDSAHAKRTKVETVRNPLLAAALSQAQLPLLTAIPMPADDLCDEATAYDEDDSIDVQPSIPIGVDVVSSSGAEYDPIEDLVHAHTLPSDYDPVIPEDDSTGEIVPRSPRLAKEVRPLNRPMRPAPYAATNDWDIVLIEDEPGLAFDRPLANG